jgi:hypothetical protein
MVLDDVAIRAEELIAAFDVFERERIDGRLLLSGEVQNDHGCLLGS